MPATNPSTLHPNPSLAALPHNSELSLWLSVDPLSDKYPNLSPYVYCANNPVRLVDKDGREIWIRAADNNEYQYCNGQLYTKSGEVHTIQQGSYEEQVVNSLTELRKTKIGEKIIGSLETCKEKVRIIDANSRPDGTGKDEFVHTGSLSWNSQKSSVNNVLTTNGEQCSPTTNLGHELGHAYDHFVEHLPATQLDNLINGCKISEWRAVYYENRMRKEMGLPYRTGYRTIKIYPETGEKKTVFTRMLNRKGEPIKIG